jgi:hypothetical protein
MRVSQFTSAPIAVFMYVDHSAVTTGTCTPLK